MGSKEPLLDAVKRLSYITARGAANWSFRIEKVFLTCAQADVDSISAENRWIDGKSLPVLEIKIFNAILYFWDIIYYIFSKKDRSMVLYIDINIWYKYLYTFIGTPYHRSILKEANWSIKLHSQFSQKDAVCDRKNWLWCPSSESDVDDWSVVEIVLVLMSFGVVAVSESIPGIFSSPDAVVVFFHLLDFIVLLSDAVLWSWSLPGLSQVNDHQRDKCQEDEKTGEVHGDRVRVRMSWSEEWTRGGCRGDWGWSRKRLGS